MSKKTKKQAVTAPVPQSRGDAEQMLARLGDVTRHITVHETALEESVAKVKQAAEEGIKPLRDEQQRLLQGLEVWATANRQALTDGGKTKTVRLTTGLLCWREAPASVSIRGVEAVLEELRARQLTHFIRTKSEVDKEAMLREPETARKVPGVTIASKGEAFAAEPTTLAQAAE